MFDDIYKLLSSGEATPDELARTFADTLNAAEKRIAEEQEAKRKAEEEAAIAEAEKTALIDRKRSRLADILGLYGAYLDEFYPAIGEQVKDEDLNDMVDSIMILIDRMAQLGEVFGNVELSSGQNNNKLNVKFQFDEPEVEAKQEDESKYFFNPFFRWFF